MKKWIASVLAASMTLAVMTGCSGNESSSGSASGFAPSMDTNAEAVINVNGSWSNFQALESAAADWNKLYPNVEINYVKVDAYNSMLSKQVTGDDPPDIVMFDPSGYYEEKDAILESLVDLSGIGLELSALNAGAVTADSVDGRLCALPWGVLATGFVANTTLLGSLGLDIPQTHEEFMQVCSTLAENGYTPLQGCTDTFYSFLMNNDIKYRLMGLEDPIAFHDYLEAVSEGCGDYFADEFSDMLEMTEKGFISSDINDSITDYYEGNILHFFKGGTPFLCFNTEGFSGMKKRESQSEHFTAEPFEYEFVPLPVCSDEPVLSRGFLPGLAVVEGSGHQAWAEEFLRFVCSSELDQMASVKGVPSTSASGSEDPRYSHISSIPDDKRVVPYEDTISQLSDESFAYTLEHIADGTLTDTESTCRFFEYHLKGLIG